MLKTTANPEGTPIDVFDAVRSGPLADRSQLCREFSSSPFYEANRPGSQASGGIKDAFWCLSVPAAQHG